MDRVGLHDDPKTRSAVLHLLLVLGEAVKRVPRSCPATLCRCALPRTLEHVPPRVGELEAEVVVLVTRAAHRRPRRWLVPVVLRLSLARVPALESLLAWPAMKRLVTTGLHRPDAALEPRLRRLGVEVRRLGDCENPGRTREAMASAAHRAQRP